MKKRSAAILFLFLGPILFLTGCQHEIGLMDLQRTINEDEIPVEKEEKIYWKGTIEDDFDGSSVLVVILDNFSCFFIDR